MSYVILITSFMAIVLYGMVLVVGRGPRERLGAKCENHSPSEATIVVAARNEETAIKSCLESLLAQTRVERIIVVDDHSTDRTRDVVTNMLPADDRLDLLVAPVLPSGWVGKSHALHFGATAAKTDYLVFIDADVLLEPGAVSTAIQRMDAERLDHLSGFFLCICESRSEAIFAQVLTTVADVFLFRAADTVGAAMGAFNAVRTDFYREQGGHSSIRASVVDDVALARHLVSRGGVSRFLNLSHMVSVRLFEGARGFFGLASRSAQAYLKRSPLLAVLGGLGLVILAATTILNPVLWLLELSRVSEPTKWVSLLAWGSAYVTGGVAVWRGGRYCDAHGLWSLLYPYGVGILAAATLVSGVRDIVGAGVEWRGRSYRGIEAACADDTNPDSSNT